MTDTPRTRVAEKAASDPAFRQALIANPKAALRDLLGAPIPAHINVVVLEDTSNTVHLVLPPTTGDRELTDAELEKVAGGECGQWGGNSWSTW